MPTGESLGGCLPVDYALHGHVPKPSSVGDFAKRCSFTGGEANGVVPGLLGSTGTLRRSLGKHQSPPLVSLRIVWALRGGVTHCFLP